MLLCYVTGRHLLNRDASADDLLASIHAAIRAGVDWVQIREKDLSARALFELTRAAVEFTSAQEHSPDKPPTKIIVNDRLDVALAAAAAGVHLGGKSLEIAEVSRWRGAGNLPSNFLIGASCHSVEEAIAVEHERADYVFLGPIFETPSKLHFGPPLGIEKLAHAAEALRIPVLAIGGVNARNLHSCWQAGASGIAAIRLFQPCVGDLSQSFVAHLRAVS